MGPVNTCLHAEFNQNPLQFSESGWGFGETDGPVTDGTTADH